MNRRGLTHPLGGALLVLVVASGCSSGASDSEGSQAPRSAASSAASSAGSAALSATDAAFVTRMRTLGEQALRLSREADGAASDPQVRMMARGLTAAQRRDLAALADHGDGSMPMMGDASASHGDDGDGDMMMDDDEMSGQVSEQMDEQMDELSGLRGGPFDDRFLALMGENHRAMLAAAEDEVAHGSDDATRRLAGTMARQSRERLAEMDAMMDAMAR